jgi:hypothetical protein
MTFNFTLKSNKVNKISEIKGSYYMTFNFTLKGSEVS